RGENIVVKERGSQNGEYDGRVMTEEQMEILRKQIAMYAVICGQLVSLHESLSSKLPVSSGTTEMLVSFKIVKTASGDIVFKPFVEVKKEPDLLPSSPELSLARLNMKAGQLSLFLTFLCCFSRTQEWKKETTRDVDGLEKRGGRVQLKPMVMPQSEFDYVDKGDVVYAMELALSLEKLVNAKLLYVFFFKDEFLI
ncbi:hypothetical protein IGI04_026953, partial [Brassica rapa subsp. trilocularis]